MHINVNKLKMLYQLYIKYEFVSHIEELSKWANLYHRLFVTQKTKFRYF